MLFRRYSQVIAGGLLMLTALAACESLPGTEANYPRREGTRVIPDPSDEPRETVFGPGGLFNTARPEGEGTGSGIGVNSFLWRASLDTLSFMPLSSADPFGGVIITDWYSPPETPDERFKLIVYILDRRLRADGLKVAVFKQNREASGGGWITTEVNEDTRANIENAILTRARQLRIDYFGE
jgi:hypothetical protein